MQFIDASDHHPTRAVKLGDDSDNVRYDPAAKRLFVGFGGGALAAIDPANGKVIGEAKLAGHPESFQLERSTSHVFVNVPDASQIAVVDRAAMKVIATWPVVSAKANFPMALDSPTIAFLSDVAGPPKSSFTTPTQARNHGRSTLWATPMTSSTMRLASGCTSVAARATSTCFRRKMGTASLAWRMSPRPLVLARHCS